MNAKQAIDNARKHNVPEFRIVEMLMRGPYLLTEDEALKMIAIYDTQDQEVQKEIAKSVPQESTYTPCKLNRSAVKEFGLEVSSAKKAGKFERVSGSFVKQIEADLENFIQGICRNPHSEDDIKTEYDFLNWKQVGPRVREVLNRAVRRAIFSRVKNYPSQGKTLK